MTRWIPLAFLISSPLAWSASRPAPSSPVPPAPACEVSAAWSLLDESGLDISSPSGTQATPVQVGCGFRALAGAGGVLELGDEQVPVEVLGLRRAQGVLIVGLTAKQASELGTEPATVEITRKTDQWEPLLAAMDAIHRAR